MKLKIGFDVHGVIDTDPERFAKTLKYMVNKRFEVLIISGPPTEEIIVELNSMGIKEAEHYHRVFSIVDYLKSKNTDMWQDKNGRWWADEDIWWGSKAAICKEHRVQLMIDDTEKYRKHFKGSSCRFILYKGEDK